MFSVYNKVPVTKKVVISQDYDGCFDIMTKEGAEAELVRNKWYWFDLCKESGIATDARLELTRQKYNDYLSSITQDADSVHVYVGSDRQSYALDRHNAKVHSNGSVFSALQKLCKTRSSANQAWVFEPLLLADPDDKSVRPYGKRRGEAHRAIGSVNEHLYCAEKESSKVKLILHQIWDAYRQNPRIDEIEFHFIDDRKDLLDDILKNVSHDLFPQDVAWTFKVTKFDHQAVMSDEEKGPFVYGEVDTKPVCHSALDISSLISLV